MFLSFMQVTCWKLNIPPYHTTLFYINKQNVEGDFLSPTTLDIYCKNVIRFIKIMKTGVETTYWEKLREIVLDVGGSPPAPH